MKHALRWRLFVGGMLAVVMLLGMAAPAMAAVTDVFYGITGAGLLQTYDPVTGTAATLIDVAPPLPATSVGPNGLGFDELTNRLYYAEYPDQNGDNLADLYFTDLDDSPLAATYAGKLPTPLVTGGKGVSDADIYEGVYYYINHGSDDLYAVTFNADGTIAAISPKVDASANAHRWTFDGDIAIWEGVIYGWGNCGAHGRYEFFKVNIDGTGFALLDNTLSEAALQLAFASDGTLYGHNYGSGRTYRVAWDALGNVTATFLRVAASRYTDTASGSTGTDLGYSLTGSKWYDRDKDAIWDVPGEAGIGGWKVYLYEGEPNIADPTITDWSPVADTLTAADGSYSFDGLEPGTYKVAEGIDADPNSCWSQTAPASGFYEVTITDAGAEDLDFGNVCEKTSTGGYTLGYWSNKNGSGDLTDYNTENAEYIDPITWQAFLTDLNLVGKTGADYDPTTYAAFRTWLLRADATNMSYMLSVQMAATNLNVEVQNADYDGYGVLDMDGSWISIADLLLKANAFLGIEGNEVLIEASAARTEAEFYKNIFDRLNNNTQVLIKGTQCDVPLAWAE